MEQISARNDNRANWQGDKPQPKPKQEPANRHERRKAAALERRNARAA